MTWNDLPGAVIAYDGLGQVKEANQAAAEVLGITRGRLLSSFAEDTDWLVLEAPDGPISVHPVTAAIKSRQPVHGVLARHRRPDGTDVWLQVDAVPEVGGADEVTRIVVSLTDELTMVKKAM